MGVRKNYSTPIYPQGNLIVKRYRRSLKKGFAASVSEKGRELGLFLSSVAFGYSSTPHVGTEFLPLLLLHGREVVLLVQRYLDEPSLDPERKTSL